MNLDAIQVELRPRRGWEAVDLGCSLVRRFAGSVWKAWVVLVLPAQILLCALLWEHPLIALTLLWWFKPFASSVVLQVLSRELFGQSPKLGQLLRELPKHWLKLSPTFLFTQRFNPARCFVQPLYELEGNLSSKRRKQRLRSLSNYSLSSSNLTTICMILEPILLFGLLNLGLMAVPESIQEGWWKALEDLALSTFDFSADMHEQWLGLRQLILVLFVLIMLLLEPFYIGGGFLLYLNARTILEGWDIEVGFKRMSQRLQKLGFTPSTPPAVSPTPVPQPVPVKPVPQPVPVGGPPKPEALQTATVTNPNSQLPPRPQTQPQPQASQAEPQSPSSPDSSANSSANSSTDNSADSSNPHQRQNPPNNTFILLLLSLLSLGLALASTPSALAQVSSSNSDPQKQAEEILAHPDFEVQTKRIPKPEQRSDFDGDLSWLGSLLQIFSKLLLGLLALAFIGLLVWLILNYLSRRKNATPQALETHAITTATHLAGLDLRAESLPDDIPASAQELWSQGQAREALALLYRGSLAWLQSQAKLPILSADTEQDCLRRSAQSKPLQPIQPYFDYLTNTWIRAAYARDLPRSSSFQELCESWPFQPEVAAQIQHALAAEENARLNKTSLASKPSSQLGTAATRLLPLLIILPLLLNSCSEQEFDEIETGYLSEARRNPYLAASRLLDQNGWSSQSSRSLNELRNQEPDFILAPAASVNDEAAVSLLQDAVLNGAHFCLLLEDGEPWLNSYIQDVETNSSELDPESQLAQWLEDLNIIPSDTPSYQESIRVQLPELESQNYQLWQPSNTRFEPQQAQDRKLMQLTPTAGNTQASKEEITSSNYPALLSRPYGLGRVTVLVSAAPFRNRYLAERDHAAFFLDLVNLSSRYPSQIREQTSFSYYQSPSFSSNPQNSSLTPKALIILRTEAHLFRLLWQHGWPAIIAGALAFLLMLWARMPRRQPVAEELEESQRFHVEDQLIGMGSFFWSHGQREDLLGALRRRVIRQWRQQNPLSKTAKQLSTTLEAEELEALAKLTNLPTQKVSYSLQEHHGELSASELEALIRSLQSLHAKLLR